MCGQKLLLAVSGGADSTAMLIATSQVAKALELTLATASLDHGLRADSAEEVRRVSALCRGLGVALYSKTLALRDGPGLEGRARRARYLALEEIRVEAGCAFIATAHTASDQAETLLMRLLRGTSLGGASGIRPRLGRLIRPLLGCTRAEVESFLSDHRISFAVDPMNEDFRFARARVRAQLIPTIESLAGPRAVRRLAAFAAEAASDAALLDELAAAAHARLLVGAGRLDAAGVRALPPALRRRVVARLLSEAGARVDRSALSRALAAVSVSGSATLSRGVELRCSGGLIRCTRGARGLRSSQPSLALAGGWIEDSVSGLRIGLADALPAACPPGGWLQIPDASLPLSVRHRRPGDRVGPLAGKGAKVQDLMVDLGIPREERDSIPVVCDAAGRIVWVVGVWPRRTQGAAAAQAGGPGPFVLAERISAPPSARRSGSL
ncbi:MAG TPA: tRNA lysidine(34) synthetase TilS [Myxococcaceae bacterium]|nr:tRNA lysidine(34) synthetase TilS [Myxococcaceae bacterium]